MGITEELCQYVSFKDKVLYTILVHDHTIEELIDIVKKKLENINKRISSSFKKKLINDKIYSFINYLESVQNQTDKINSVFLINDKINRIDMSLSEKSFCKNWNISNFIFEFDEEFKIDYLSELLSTKMIKCVFKFDKSSYSVIHLDSTKSKVVENHSSLDEDSITKFINQHKPVAIYGLCPILKKLSHLESKNLSVINKQMSNNDVLELIKVKNIEFNQELFKTEFLDNINNPALLDKLIFGKKDISEAINNFLIKKLFINPKLYKILKDNADSSTLNFEIIIVQSLKSGDLGQTLNKNYNGMVGIKYY
tara:strand:+ start:455 stop:1384 length:930 start_codon:yes stop_codon:yes gene_type:complete